MRAAALLAPLLLAACGGEEEATSPADDWGDVRPPDVVVVLLDTLRADALSFYGAREENAPFLTNLARGSTVFEHTYSTSTWTAPATASVLTGCYPDRHGVTRGFVAHVREEEGRELDRDREYSVELAAISRSSPTLAERFRDMGYLTLGLATNLNIGSEMAFDRGFDRFERHRQATVRDMRARLREWRGELEGDRPVFLYLHLNDVHEPYEPRPRFLRPPEDRSDPVARAYAYYRSEIGFVDSFLGKLYEEWGWGDGTLLAVVADHGEEFMDHGQMAHQFTLYSELARVPMLLHGPDLGIEPGRVQANVSVVDLAPTLLDLVGRPIEEVDGHSLADLCRRRDKTLDQLEARDARERPLFLHRFEDGEHLWGVVVGRWKLIENHDGTLELYDLAADPGETENLAPEQPRRCDRLLALLDRHRERAVAADSERSEVELDEELMEALDSLGYVK